MQIKKNDAELENDYTDLVCSKCNVNLVIGPVSLEYLGNGFPVELPKCPKCGMSQRMLLTPEKCCDNPE